MSDDVRSKHPEYVDNYRKWVKCRDNFKGQDAIKRRTNYELDKLEGRDNYYSYSHYRDLYGQTYLPPTNGMMIDGMAITQPGYRNYQSYLMRAYHAPFFSAAVQMMLGLLWNKDSSIELGPLESIFGGENGVTRQKESIRELMMRVNKEQLITGRLGLLADLPSSDHTDPRPYIALYKAEDIINWDVGARDEVARDSLNLVVLDESQQEREKFEWEWKEKYRVLWLGNLEANEEGPEEYHYQIFREVDGDYKIVDEGTPNAVGTTLNVIPFQIINTTDLNACTEEPPLIGLADALLTTYRADADYRQALHMQCQDTLVTSGAQDDEVKAVGAGAHIALTNPQAKAYFIGIDSKGLPELRQAVEQGLMQCAKMAGELLADNSRARESGDALEQRIGTKSASLTQIATTCAEGVQKILRVIAKWLGHSDDEVSQIVIKPNLEFTNKAFDPQDLKALVESMIMGGPIRPLEIHEWMVKRGFTNKNWEEVEGEKFDTLVKKILDNNTNPQEPKGFNNQ